jgi:hypothetical protein
LDPDSDSLEILDPQHWFYINLHEMKWATFFSCYIIFNYGVFHRHPDQSLVAQLRGEVEELRRQLRQSVVVAADNEPTIFVITPTYARPVQIGRPENQFYVGLFYISFFCSNVVPVCFSSSCKIRTFLNSFLYIFLAN